MKRNGKLLALLFALLLFFVGCSPNNRNELSGLLEGDDQLQAQNQASDNNDAVVAAIIDTSNMFSSRDYEMDYYESSSTVIALNGTSAQCSSDAVEISDSTIKIMDEGTYILSGILNDGMIVVDAKNTDKIQLVLNEVSINSSSSAAIYIIQADKVFVTLEQDSVNTLSNGGEFIAIDENNIDAVIFSKDDLTLNGTGSLTISSPAGHGIVCKDDLVVTGGSYEITAASHAFAGKQSVRIADGSFVITSGKDGVHAEDADDASLGFAYISGGIFYINAEGDGIAASNTLQIDNGDFAILTGGGSETVTQSSDGNWGWGMQDKWFEGTSNENSISTKGIKAAGDILLNGGNYSIDSADDAIHSNMNLTVAGGSFNLATGDDGLHADELAKVIGGTISISKSYEGIEGLCVDLMGGDISIVSSDDGLNAAGGNDGSGFGGGSFGASSESYVNISGGTLNVNAAGDGIDSNGDLTVTGGVTYISGPTNSANGALDYGGEATISNGIFVAAGAAGMASNFGSSSTQGVMMLNISSSEDETLTLTNSSEQSILSWKAEKEFSSIIISCPEIVQGETYTVSVGSASMEITMDSLVYGSFGGMSGNPPGGMGGNPPGGMGGGRR